MFPWTRRFVVYRFPAGTRCADCADRDSIDSMGEMRAALSAMGGWDEHHERDVLRPMGRARQLERKRQRQQRRQLDESYQRRGRSMPPEVETTDEGYSTEQELSSSSSPAMLAASRIPFPSRSMAPLPRSALQARPSSTTSSTGPPPAVPHGLHVKVASPRRELREVRHVKGVEERRGRRRKARRLDSVDPYAAYLGDQSSLDEYADECGKGKEKARAVEGRVAAMWRVTHD